MDNRNLFKEAIADAKAVREAALANAKAALEETLTPRLQSMLSAKLQEMESEDELDESKKSDEEVKEGFDTQTFGWDDEDNASANKVNEEEDFDLAEILAELDDESEIDEAKKEDKKEKKEDEKSKKEKKEDHEENESPEDEKGEDEGESEEEVEVKDMSVEDLQSMIRDIVSQEMGGGVGLGDEAPADDNLDAGLEAPIGGDADALSIPSEEDELDEIDLEELLAELDALDEAKKSKHEKSESTKKEKDEHASGKEKKEKSEMKEALETIQILRNELNEQHLLNSKLLYVNKLFKSKNLTESQKVRVIASFDKAKTVKEAKAVFEALQENLNAPAKKQIKENLGFASKAAGIAPKKQQIVESDDAIARMKKLAGLK